MGEAPAIGAPAPALLESPVRLKKPTGTAEDHGMTSGTATAVAAPTGAPRQGTGTHTGAAPAGVAVVAPRLTAAEDDVPTSPVVPLPDDGTRTATYGQLFALREYRALFTADLVSLLGDQIAAVAVAVLLYQRSGSALFAALGYATAFAPWFLGGPLLAAWAERRPPRAVLLGCDVARAGLIGLAALPGLPLPLVALLVLVAAFLAPPFDAVGQSVLVEALPGDTYPLGASVRSVVHQVTQLAGFVAGGALIALMGSHRALAVDAASFLVSAAVLRWGLAARPAPVDHGARAAATEGTSEATAPSSLLADTVAGIRIVAADPRLRLPLLTAVVVAATVIVPEAVATAYADSFGGGPGAVGMIMASTAAGSALGALVLGRAVSPARRVALLVPLSVASCLLLGVLLAHPGLVVSLVVFAVAGAASSGMVVASTLFGRAVAPAVRARAFAVAMAAMYGGQTAAIVLAGLAATLVAPHLVIAVAGLLGGAACLLIGRDLHRQGPVAAG
ncbi:MAG: MFS transporter [Kineosporiaceae bacterium]